MRENSNQQSEAQIGTATLNRSQNPSQRQYSRRKSQSRTGLSGQGVVRRLEIILPFICVVVHNFDLYRVTF